MNKRLLFHVFPYAIIFSLLAAFLFFTPVFAQDETPPTEPAPEETPVEETAPLGETLAESGVEVVDESGEAIPLAAEALTAVDPYFKVGTVTYSFTLADCDPDTVDNQPCANPLQKAVDYIRVHGTIPTDGLIHVDAGTLPDQAVVIDGSNANEAKIKGIVGHVNPDNFSPDAILSKVGATGSLILIRDKLTGFILSGLSIDGNSTNPHPITQGGVVDIRNGAGTLLLQDLVVHDANSSADAITIMNHNGAVTLKNVDTSGNSGAGALISNLTGAAGITVTNSSFDGNFYSGLEISSNGAVVLSGISASRNDGTYPSVWIHQASSVTITGSVFDDNPAGWGLVSQDIPGAITLQNVYVDHNLSGISLTAKGNITLSGVSASNNSFYGATLDTCTQVASICTWLGTGKVTISSSHFDDNINTTGTIQYGLNVIARGTISISDVTADRNGSVGNPSYGALLDTSQSQLVSPVTISTSRFNHNWYSEFNLLVLAKGAITLTSVEASENQAGGGVSLENISPQVRQRG